LKIRPGPNWAERICRFSRGTWVCTQTVTSGRLSGEGKSYSIQQTSKDSPLIRVALKLAGFE